MGLRAVNGRWLPAHHIQRTSAPMIFTREQYYELWVKYAGDSATHGTYEMYKPRSIDTIEYTSHSAIHATKLPDFIMDIAELDAIEAGISEASIKSWRADTHLSLIWSLIWKRPGVWGNPE
jgi:hypothetical protein